MTALPAPAPAAPTAEADVVGRPSLAARLAVRQVTVLAAPTGYGKTTLLAQWGAAETRHVAWLTLEPNDRDPRRLWSRVGAVVGVAVAEALPEDAIARLVNGLDRREPLVLVLDDVHVLRGSAVEPTLAHFVERLPPSIRLVVAGRAVPALPLAALAAADRLELLRTADLTLAPAEVIWLARRVAPLPRTGPELRALVRDTEGWPAGAYLVAHAPAEGGRWARHVAEYLWEELVGPLSARDQDFLLRTSVLDRLTPGLCDALLGRTDSGETLDRLAGSGIMFVQCAEGGLRYHRLLAGLLRDELARRLPADARGLQDAATRLEADTERRSSDDAAARCAAEATDLYFAGRPEEALAVAAEVGVERAQEAPAATAACFAVRSLVWARLSRPTAALAAARTSMAIEPCALGLLALAGVELRADGRVAARRSLQAALALAGGQPPLEAAIHAALAGLESDDPPGRTAPPGRSAGEELSSAELRVMRLLSGPLTQREIGRELYLSLNTVKTHVCAIYRKLGVQSRADAIGRARRLNLIPPG